MQSLEAAAGEGRWSKCCVPMQGKENFPSLQSQTFPCHFSVVTGGMVSLGEVQSSRDREDLQRLSKSKQGHKDSVSCF